MSGFANQAELAAMLGLSVRQIRRLREAGMPCEGPKGRPRYPVAECVRWYVASQRLPASNLAEVRLREATAKAELKEIELQQKRRELVPVGEAASIIRSVYSTLNSALRNVPARYSGQIAKGSDTKKAKVQKALAKAMEEVRGEIRSLATEDILKELKQ